MEFPKTSFAPFGTLAAFELLQRLLSERFGLLVSEPTDLLENFGPGFLKLSPVSLAGSEF